MPLKSFICYIVLYISLYYGHHMNHLCFNESISSIIVLYFNMFYINIALILSELYGGSVHRLDVDYAT